MKLDVRGLAEAKDRLEKLKLRTLNLTPVLVVAEEILRKTSSDAFRAETDPNTGIVWKDVVEKTREKKTKARKEKILMWTGTLRDSVATRHDKDTVFIGSNVPYARAHQLGSPATRLPARPYLPSTGSEPGSITGKAIAKIRALLTKYILTGSVA